MLASLHNVLILLLYQNYSKQPHQKNLSLPRRRESTAYQRGAKHAINYLHLPIANLMVNQTGYFFIKTKAPKP